MAVAGAGAAYWWHRRSGGGDGPDGSASGGVELMGQPHRYTLMPGRETEPAPLLLSAASAEPSPQRSQRTSPLRGPPSLRDQGSPSPGAVAAMPSSNGSAGLPGAAAAAGAVAATAAAAAAAEAGMEAGEDHWAAVAAEAGAGDDWGAAAGDWGEDWEDLPTASSAAAAEAAQIEAPPATGAAAGEAAAEAAPADAAPEDAAAAADPEAGNGWNRPAAGGRGTDSWDEDW